MKKVLVLGAGMVARPLVRYLLDRDFAITQGDIAVENAAAMIDGHPNGTAITLDISNDDELKKLSPLTRIKYDGKVTTVGRILFNKILKLVLELLVSFLCDRFSGHSL